MSTTGSEDDVSILAMSGSGRAGSPNTALLHAARGLAPAGVTIEIHEGLAQVPRYDRDEDTESRLPPAARDLRAAVAKADGLLIATGELAFAVPEVVRTALAWLVRPAMSTPLLRKDVAVIGVSPGGFGTVRGQVALRQLLAGYGHRVLSGPELLVSAAHDRFDRDGHLIDHQAAQRLREVLAALREQIVHGEGPGGTR
ncbi:NADPH-dependent FMN reductase [Amycolatopsis sp. NPDC050768]|uniref:NADPH-dependent FMN reductase n=1 Tax=Amycolatopsis sp. NPDC050768 TaxID=3154839 RepID=UPI0033CA2BA3